MIINGCNPIPQGGEISPTSHEMARLGKEGTKPVDKQVLTASPSSLSPHGPLPVLQFYKIITELHGNRTSL